MAVDERRGSVVFAKQAAVDVVEPIPRNEPVPAGGTCEALEMVHVALRPHHQFAGWNRLTTGAASSAVPE